MPSIPQKKFLDEIKFNTINSLSKEMFWTSEPYKFNVVRWMAHEDEMVSYMDGQLYPAGIKEFSPSRIRLKLNGVL